MRLNTTAVFFKALTHQGAPSRLLTPLQKLRRTLLTSMLWEDTYYEDGETVSDRLCNNAALVSFEKLAELTLEAKTKYKIRHAPLLMALQAVKHHNGKKVGQLICDVITRPDELCEILAMYWKDGWKEGKKPLAKQLKVGLAKAFQKFDEYQLAKYNRDNPIKLRDVLFLCHAKPKDADQDALWKRLINGTLAVPDTWEVRLSKGEDKKQSFTELLQEKKLGYMALLRNMRNMHDSGVDPDLVKERLLQGASKSKALPFRFITAARAVVGWEKMIEEAMLLSLKDHSPLQGNTAILVDVSGSMSQKLSSNSELSMMDAACSLAILLREVCETPIIYSFSSELIRVPARQGFALADAIINSQRCLGTYLAQCLRQMHLESYTKFDRLIVITDEQTADDPQFQRSCKNYVINVGNYQNGISYKRGVTSITGWSEAVVDFIQKLEALELEE